MKRQILLGLAIYCGEVGAFRILSTSTASYEGWVYFRPANALMVLLTLVVLSLISARLQRQPRTIRDMFLWWAFATILCPAWVVAGWSDFFDQPLAIRGALITTFGYLIVLASTRLLSRTNILDPFVEPVVFRMFTAILLLGAVASLVLILGVPSLADLSLKDTYDRRREFTSQISTTAAYVTNWTTFVLMPAAITLSLRYRNPLLALGGATTGFLVYAWVGAKNALLLAAVAIVVSLLSKPGRQGRLLNFPSFVAAIAIFPNLLYLFFGSDQLVYLISRRALLVPAWNQMAHLQLGETLGTPGGLTWLIPATSGQGYDRTVYGSFAVGDLLQPGGSLNANSHFLSFPMQWDSLLAVGVVAVLASVILWILDCSTTGRDQQIAVCIGTVACLNLSETYLHTGLVTGGLALATVVVLLAPKATLPPGQRSGHISSSPTQAASL